jgi:hypothetical protein
MDAGLQEFQPREASCDAYQVTPDLHIWITTEANRSSTTSFLPSEY